MTAAQCPFYWQIMSQSLSKTTSKFTYKDKDDNKGVLKSLSADKNEKEMSAGDGIKYELIEFVEEIVRK